MKRQKYVPLEKQSKKDRQAFHAARRKDWGGLNPITRKPPDPKAYNRKKSGPRFEHEPRAGFRVRVLAILLLSAFLFSSCGQGGPEQTPYQTFDPYVLGTPDPSQPSATPRSSDPRDRLTVVIPEQSVPAYLEKALDTVNRLLDDQGFQVAVEFFYDPELDPRKHPVTSSAAYQALSGQYQEKYRDYIRSNLHSDKVFFQYGDMSDLEREGLLGDFYAEAKKHAPVWLSHPAVQSANEPGRLVYMPAGFFTPIPANIPLVLVREDIAASYGQDINTASDFVELLTWLRAWDPLNIPCAAYPPYSFSRFMPFDLFLPERGYWLAMGTSPLAVQEIGGNASVHTASLPDARYAVE